MAANGAPEEEEGGFADAPQLRGLYRLVKALTIVLICGMLSVFGFIMWNIAGLGGSPAAGPVAAEALRLPPGETVTASGEGPGALHLVTRDAAGALRLRRFDAASGAELSVTPIERR